MIRSQRSRFSHLLFNTRVILHGVAMEFIIYSFNTVLHFTGEQDEKISSHGAIARLALAHLRDTEVT